MANRSDRRAERPHRSLPPTRPRRVIGRPECAYPSWPGAHTAPDERPKIRVQSTRRPHRFQGAQAGRDHRLGRRSHRMRARAGSPNDIPPVVPGRSTRGAACITEDLPRRVFRTLEDLGGRGPVPLRFQAAPRAGSARPSRMRITHRLPRRPFNKQKHGRMGCVAATSQGPVASGANAGTVTPTSARAVGGGAALADTLTLSPRPPACLPKGASPGHAGLQDRLPRKTIEEANGEETKFEVGDRVRVNERPP